MLAHHAAALWGDGGQSRKERARRAMEQAADVKEYGKEKLYNDILEILSGTRTIGGGFAKLVQRFSRLMSGHLKYDDEKLRNNAKTISAMLIGRGHSVSPMPHGNCNAGPAKPSAKCFEKDRLAWDKASPLVCGKCPYHSMKEVHLKAIQDDLERQRAEAEKWTTDTLHATSARASLDATERLVTFYLQRNSAEQAASQ